MKKNITAVFSWFAKHWRGVVVSILLAVLAIVTLSMQLSSLVPGQNIYESQTLAQIQHFPKPWFRAVNAPYLVPAYIVGKVIGDPLHGARLVSVAYGLLATALAFYIIRNWFNIRIATVGTLLFITSSWLLHVTHTATPLIMLVFAPVLVIAPLAWFIQTKKYKWLSFMLLAAALAIAAYVPYMLWVIIASFVILILFESKIVKGLRQWQIGAAAAIYGLLLLPLFISLVNHPGQLHELLGIPKNFPSFTVYLQQLLDTVSMIVFRSQSLPAMNLGHLPALDIFSATMLMLGIYYFASRIRTRRSIILFTNLTLLILLLPLTTIYQLYATVLMPYVYILVISGIVELLNQWFGYFPRNPWARNFGVAMVVIAIGFASFYHLQRYFIAWPNSPETRAAYTVVPTQKQ